MSITKVQQAYATLRFVASQIDSISRSLEEVGLDRPAQRLAMLAPEIENAIRIIQNDVRKELDQNLKQAEDMAGMMLHLAICMDDQRMGVDLPVRLVE